MGNSSITGLYKTRGYLPEDYNFVRATFLQGLYYGNEFYNLIPKTVFMDNYKQVIHALILGGKTDIVIACLVEDEDVILGFSILSNDHTTLHWCHVKAAWRKQGIGTTLVPKSVQDYTHFSTLGLAMKPKMNFNPFKL